jgi:hypothetical protein
MPELFDDTPPPCPECEERSATPIIYGNPSSEMLVVARLGDIVLGGIAEQADAPEWLCSCGKRYRD